MVEYEHAEFGTARVCFDWRESLEGTLRWVPVAVEFDLFTPDSEKEALTRDLERVRVDMPISVSASGNGDSNHV